MDPNEKDSARVASDEASDSQAAPSAEAAKPSSDTAATETPAVDSAPAEASSPGEEKPAPQHPAPKPVDASPEPAAEPATDDAEPKLDPVQAAKQEAERARNQMLRIAADFDNFRKRSRREVEDASRRSREEFLRELLPVFDNLERAALHADQATDSRAVADGVKMVLRQFQDTLAKVGLARVKSVGAPFDPNIHEAIQQIETVDQPPGTVVAEVLSGYTWDDRLVRASMVVVAKSPPQPEAPAEPAVESSAEPPVEPPGEPKEGPVDGPAKETGPER